MKKLGKYFLLIIMPISLTIPLVLFSTGIFYNNTPIPPPPPPSGKLDLTTYNFQFTTSYEVCDADYSLIIQNSIDDEINTELGDLAQYIDITFNSSGQINNGLNFFGSNNANTVTISTIDDDFVVGEQTVDITTTAIDIYSWFDGTTEYPARSDHQKFVQTYLLYDNYVTFNHNNVTSHDVDSSAVMSYTLGDIKSKLYWIVDNTEEIHITSEELDDISFSVANDFNLGMPTRDGGNYWDFIGPDEDFDKTWPMTNKTTQTFFTTSKNITMISHFYN
ncbi:hypothetical protein [Spiroplasma endosymbiont of Amphibalanus improvisus]|uniref:hypothetical protein n=1 Tax=Spiroplasma endosymbiont of Amphibalanus improvisus TaxID=3066327 RepID=UPI00313CAE3F